MGRGWLLFEVLGGRPVVVAQHDKLRNFIPAAVFLQRNAYRDEITALIATATRRRERVTHRSADGHKEIHAMPVVMTDGVVHGVQVWLGPRGASPPPRVVPGSIKWDLTTGLATDCPQALQNAGKDLAVEPTHGRTFASDMPIGVINPAETKVLALAIDREPGSTFSGTWDLTGSGGEPVRAAFVSRVLNEPQPDNVDHRICRAMNWRVAPNPTDRAPDDLAITLVLGTARAGAHRALLDLNDWRILKWIDTPSPDFDWQKHDLERPLIHPEDASVRQAMATQWGDGAASGVLRLRNTLGGWTPIHIEIQKVEIKPGTVLGLASFRVAQGRGSQAHTDL